MLLTSTYIIILCDLICYGVLSLTTSFHNTVTRWKVLTDQTDVTRWKALTDQTDVTHVDIIL